MIQFKHHILLLFILIFVSTQAQLTIEERNNTVADCNGAIEIHHFKESIVQFSGQYGYLDELNDIDNSAFEQNSVWLKLDPQINGSITFEFQTIDHFNFEYFLFLDTIGNFCQNKFEDGLSDFLIEQGEIIYDKDKNITSLSSIKTEVKSSSTSVFYLLLHSKEIHQKSVRLNFKLEGDKIEESIHTQIIKKVPTLKSFTLKLRDKVTKQAVLGIVTVTGLRVDDQFFLGSDFIFDAHRSKLYNLKINAEGYFLYYEKIKIETLKDSELLIELEPLAPGKKLKIEGLYFKPNSKEFLPISYLALRRLLEFLILNSEVKIEIQGHVHAIGSANPSKARKLSENRAKNAYLFLIQNGIDKKRLTYVGKGNTEMINPNPKTKAEEEVNRRVEILIVE